MSILGSNIRYLRKKHNYSQDKLAEVLGYKSFTTIQKWESGVAEPPFKTLAKLAELFRVDIDDLAKKDLYATSAPLYEAAAGEGRLNDGYPTEEYKIALEPEEHKLIEDYRTLDTEDKAELRGVVKGMLMQDKYKGDELSDAMAI